MVRHKFAGGRWIGEVYHIETPLAIINIRAGLASTEGETVDVVQIMPDHDARLPDIHGDKPGIGMNIRIAKKLEE